MKGFVSLITKLKGEKMEEKVLSLLETAEQATARDAMMAIGKAAGGERLTENEIAILIHRAEDVEDALFDAATYIREKTYGRRMILFAPLYLTNFCANDCLYCGFRAGNKTLARKTLADDEIEKEVRWLNKRGYRRILLEAGEHQSVPIDRVASAMKFIYGLRDKDGRPMVDRINVNIAAANRWDYGELLNAGIGTYNLFQETYHFPTYAKMHPRGPKHDYIRQLAAPSFAIRAGIGDIGMGVLYGLYDWKFETLSLIVRALDLERTYGIGPHAISFPRVKPANGVDFAPPYPVDDETYLRIIAMTRIALPYAGQIISTRESAEIRRKAFHIGISQTSAGSSTEVGGYTKEKNTAGQFAIADERPLEAIVHELLKEGFVPAFCTGCEYNNRTGTAFMRVAAQQKKIGNFCSYNALLSLAEYLRDGAEFLTKETISLGMKAIEREIDDSQSPFITHEIKNPIRKILIGENAVKFYI